MDIAESDSDEGDLNGVLCELIEEDNDNGGGNMNLPPQIA
jgi:hypothetical protein